MATTAKPAIYGNDVDSPYYHCSSLGVPPHIDSMCPVRTRLHRATAGKNPSLRGLREFLDKDEQLNTAITAFAQKFRVVSTHNNFNLTTLTDMAWTVLLLAREAIVDGKLPLHEGEEKDLLVVYKSKIEELQRQLGECRRTGLMEVREIRDYKRRKVWTTDMQECYDELMDRDIIHFMPENFFFDAAQKEYFQQALEEALKDGLIWQQRRGGDAITRKLNDQLLELKEECDRMRDRLADLELENDRLKVSGGSRNLRRQATLPKDTLQVIVKPEVKEEPASRSEEWAKRQAELEQELDRLQELKRLDRETISQLQSELNISAEEVSKLKVSVVELTFKAGTLEDEVARQREATALQRIPETKPAEEVTKPDAQKTMKNSQHSANESKAAMMKELDNLRKQVQTLTAELNTKKAELEEALATRKNATVAASVPIVSKAKEADQQGRIKELERQNIETERKVLELQKQVQLLDDQLVEQRARAKEEQQKIAEELARLKAERVEKEEFKEPPKRSPKDHHADTEEEAKKFYVKVANDREPKDIQTFGARDDSIRLQREVDKLKEELTSAERMKETFREKWKRSDEDLKLMQIKEQTMEFMMKDLQRKLDELKKLLIEKGVDPALLDKVFAEVQLEEMRIASISVFERLYKDALARMVDRGERRMRKLKLLDEGVEQPRIRHATTARGRLEESRARRGSLVDDMDGEEYDTEYEFGSELDDVELPFMPSIRSSRRLTRIQIGEDVQEHTVLSRRDSTQDGGGRRKSIRGRKSILLPEEVSQLPSPPFSPKHPLTSWPAEHGSSHEGTAGRRKTRFEGDKCPHCGMDLFAERSHSRSPVPEEGKEAPEPLGIFGFNCASMHNGPALPKHAINASIGSGSGLNFTGAASPSTVNLFRSSRCGPVLGKDEGSVLLPTPISPVSAVRRGSNVSSRRDNSPEGGLLLSVGSFSYGGGFKPTEDGTFKLQEVESNPFLDTRRRSDSRQEQLSGLPTAPSPKSSPSKQNSESPSRGDFQLVSASDKRCGIAGVALGLSCGEEKSDHSLTCARQSQSPVRPARNVGVIGSGKKLASPSTQSIEGRCLVLSKGHASVTLAHSNPTLPLSLQPTDRPSTSGVGIGLLEAATGSKVRTPPVATTVSAQASGRMWLPGSQGVDGGLASLSLPHLQGGGVTKVGLQEVNIDRPDRDSTFITRSLNSTNTGTSGSSPLGVFQVSKSMPNFDSAKRISNAQAKKGSAPSEVPKSIIVLGKRHEAFGGLCQ